MWYYLLLLLFCVLDFVVSLCCISRYCTNMYRNNTECCSALYDAPAGCFVTILTLWVRTAGYTTTGHTSLMYEVRDNPQNSTALPENFLTYATGLKGLKACVTVFSARQHICYSALYAIARPSVRPSVCPSVCPSVRHTGGSVKDGWS